MVIWVCNLFGGVVEWGRKIMRRWDEL